MPTRAQEENTWIITAHPQTVGFVYIVLLLLRSNKEPGIKMTPFHKAQLPDPSTAKPPGLNTTPPGRGNGILLRPPKSALPPSQARWWKEWRLPLASATPRDSPAPRLPFLSFPSALTMCVTNCIPDLFKTSTSERLWAYCSLETLRPLQMGTHNS